MAIVSLVRKPLNKVCMSLPKYVLKKIYNSNGFFTRFFGSWFAYPKFGLRSVKT